MRTEAWRGNHERTLTGLETVRLHTKYPCCQGKAIVKALVDVPVERYDRKCPHCGRDFMVRREVVRNERGIRVDVLEWTRLRRHPWER
jgi:transposase-like protein